MSSSKHIDLLKLMLIVSQHYYYYLHSVFLLELLNQAPYDLHLHIHSTFFHILIKLEH